MTTYQALPIHQKINMKSHSSGQRAVIYSHQLVSPLLMAFTAFAPFIPELQKSCRGMKKAQLSKLKF